MKPEQLRARVLTEWRGLPQSVARPDRTVSSGDAVRKVMQSLGLVGSPGTELEFAL